MKNIKIPEELKNIIEEIYSYGDDLDFTDQAIKYINKTKLVYTYKNKTFIPLYFWYTTTGNNQNTLIVDLNNFDQFKGFDINFRDDQNNIITNKKNEVEINAGNSFFEPCVSYGDKVVFNFSLEEEYTFYASYLEETDLDVEIKMPIYVDSINVTSTSERLVKGHNFKDQKTLLHFLPKK